MITHSRLFCSSINIENSELNIYNELQLELFDRLWQKKIWNKNEAVYKHSDDVNLYGWRVFLTKSSS